MQFNRRNFLASAVAVPAAAALATPSFAKAPLAGVPSRGMYRTKVGSAEVTALLDGHVNFNTGLLSEVDEAAVSNGMAAYGHDFDGSIFQIPVNGYLVNTGDKLVLIDTGAAGMFGDTLGRLAGNLAAAGVTPEQVDLVLLTHLHVDHVGGLLNAEGGRMFPNAELVVQQTEWDFWYDDANMAAGGEAAAGFFQAARATTTPYADRLRLLQGAEDIGAGFTALPMPGHTPGHTGFVLSSGDETLLFWGDLIHITALQFANPALTIAFDADAAVTRDTRARFLDIASTDKMLVTGAHIDFPGFGQVLRAGDAYRYQAAPWTYAF